MFKKFIFTCTFFIALNTLSAQVKTDSISTVKNSKTHMSANKSANSFKRELSVYEKYWGFGGNLGLSFWNGGTNIFLGPKAYYHLSPQFLMGVGVTYIYSDYKDDYFGYNSNSFGGSISAAYRPINFLQFSIEYEGLQTNQNGFYSSEFWNNALYLGASFVSGNVSFGFRYDVLFESNTSAYNSAFGPVVGFYF
jgi:hypothetical protein